MTSVEVSEAIASSSAVDPIVLTLIAWGSVDEAGELRTIPVGQLDLVETCKRRRPLQFAPVEGGADWWGKLLELIGLAFTPIERAAWRLSVGRSVSNAVGVQLDGVGSVVDRQRVGLVDDLYRAAIRVDGIALFGAGTREDVVGAAVGLWGDRYLGLVEVWPASQRLFVLDLSGAEWRLALDLLDEVRGGTVLTMIEVWTSYVYGCDYLAGEVEVVGWSGYLPDGSGDYGIFGYVGYAAVVGV